MTPTCPLRILCRRRIVAAAAIILAATFAGVRVAAHPAADTEVLVTLSRNGAFELTCTTALDALLIKLEALAGKPRDVALSDAAREGRVVLLQETLRNELELAIDGRHAPLVLTGIGRTGDRSGKVAIRFAGQVPAGASALTWRTGLVYGSYVFAVRREAAGSAPIEAFEWLNGGERSQPHSVIELHRPERRTQLWRSVVLGFTHILPHGLDHILFVLGLFLLAPTARTLLLQVSAFTLAHSLTLGLALFGLVSLPGAVVEPLIALSIAYVAIENLVTSQLHAWRLLLVFLFGLLHGLGFAEVLTSMRLPSADLAGTLVGFNLGVEGGQLAVILGAAGVIRALRLTSANDRRLIVRPASALIGLAGLVWMVQRLS